MITRPMRKSINDLSCTRSGEHWWATFAGPAEFLLTLPDDCLANRVEVETVIRNIHFDGRYVHDGGSCPVDISASILPALRAGAVFPINGRMGDKLLHEMLFTSLAQARVALG